MTPLSESAESPTGRGETTDCFGTGRRPRAPWALLLAAVLFAPGLGARDEADEARHWPAFRGHGDGHSPARSLPLEWSEESVSWREVLPGPGQSSPVIWGDRVFVTSLEGAQKETLFVSCLDLGTGRVRWRRELASSHPEEMTDMRSKGAPTPVVDAERVYALFESGDLFAFDHRGNRVWQRDLARDVGGSFLGNHGLGTSPAWSAPGLIVLLDHDGPSALLCLELATGEVRWRREREPRASWASPVVAGDHVVVSSNGAVDAYAVSDGEPVWSFDGVEKNTVASPAAVGDRWLITSSEKSSNLLIVPPEPGAEPTVAWRAPGAGAAGFASPVVVGERAYATGKAATLTCIAVRDGGIVWKHRLPDSCWATPIAGAGRLYFFCVDGSTVVMEPGDEPKVLAINRLPTDDRVYGVAAVEGWFTIRTGRELIAIGPR